MLDYLLSLLSSFRKHFKPLKKLGSGSFGEVYLVQRRSTKQLYVTKTVKKKYITKWGDKEEGTGTPLPMEISNMLILDHPNIVELHGYMANSTSWILVMEHSPNYCDVRQFVRRYGAFTEKLAKHVYIQVYNAVRHCFNQGVHHRDIKDQNILINKRTGHVKLIDFGSSSRGSLTQSYTDISGTLLYLPPEHFNSDKSCLPYDGAVWSMACVLFVMVSARDPFKSVAQVLTKNIGLELPGHLSTECKFFLLHCLRKDRTERLHFCDIPLHLWVLTFPGFES